MATAEEVRELSSRVSDLSETIVNVSNTQAKNLVALKVFLERQREELSASISNAAGKLDKSSRVNVWLTAAIAFFALVEAGSIFYDVTSSNKITTTDCIAVSDALYGDSDIDALPKHENNIAKYLATRASIKEYTDAYIACQHISGSRS